MTFVAVFAASILTFSGCEPENRPDENSETQKYKGLAHQTFAESDENFANPERGWYFVKSIHRASESPITASTLQVQRTFYRTIVYMGCVLKDYMESDIAEEYLSLIRANMQIMRDYGVKCVLRFSYKENEAASNKPWDASPEWVLRHIEQVKPILQEYGDVIMCYQAGYVGVWGEWYYTDHFVSNPTTPEEHTLRKQVTDAMLDALPKDRQIALRTPMFTRMMYASDYTDTLTFATAHNGSDRSRIGAFNDCFGASSNDQGTFSGLDTREFWKNDTKYVFMGGETCAISEYCLCKQTLQDMKDYHWTYLNSEYNGQVISRWNRDDCKNEIDRRLGYRLSISDIYNTPTAIAGEDFRIVLKIKNTGFAAPMNPRAVELVLVDGNGKKTVYEQNTVDPRYWFAGETATLDAVIRIPADASGDCKLYLNLPDPKETLHDNPLFSIRLANDDIWEEESGYNKVAEFTL